MDLSSGILHPVSMSGMYWLRFLLPVFIVSVCIPRLPFPSVCAVCIFRLPFSFVLSVCIVSVRYVSPQDQVFQSMFLLFGVGTSSVAQKLGILRAGSKHLPCWNRRCRGESLARAKLAITSRTWGGRRGAIKNKVCFEMHHPINSARGVG